jgi:hypothetical protein
MTERQITMTIQMTAPMSGGRPDGEPWPPPFTDFEVAEWEGRHLISSGVAVEVTDRTPPSQRPGFDSGSQTEGYPEGEPELKFPPEPVAPAGPPDSELLVHAARQEEGSPPGEPALDPEAAGTSLTGPPQPADPKQAWVDYAISKGTPPDMANAWTKQRLMAEFGGRL